MKKKIKTEYYLHQQRVDETLFALSACMFKT